jgi:ATP-dependent protease ClpP protease subunit
MENIAKVIAANTGKSAKDVTDAMFERITLNPEEAQSWGLVHGIKSELFEDGSEVIAIQFQQQPPQPPRKL